MECVVCVHDCMRKRLYVSFRVKSRKMRTGVMRIRKLGEHLEEEEEAK